jgi:hypothetical protein
MNKPQESFDSLILLLAFLTLSYLQICFRQDDFARYETGCKQIEMQRQIDSAKALLEGLQQQTIEAKKETAKREDKRLRQVKQKRVKRISKVEGVANSRLPTIGK